MRTKENQNSYSRHYSYPEPKPPWKPTTMKQKALWVFTLVFWLVAACTFFAIKTQEQMTPQVTTTQSENSYSSGTPAKLPLDCLQTDSDGGMHLYEIYEGTGWEAGVRVREVEGFSLDESNVLLENGGWGEYVQYASKPLTNGELVDVIRGNSKEPSQWLAVFPENVPDLGDLGSGIEVAAQDENTVLLSVESDVQPFMEGRAKSTVPALEGARVYCLSDMDQFLGNFVCSSLLLAIFAIVFTLWGYAWYENQFDKRYPRMWPMSLGIGIALLGGIAAVLHFVSLPSSLLPPEHITDLGYYFYEFGQFFEALERFSGQVDGVDALLRLRLISNLSNLISIFLGAGIGYLIMRWEEFLMEEKIVRKMQRHEWIDGGIS